MRHIQLYRHVQICLNFEVYIISCFTLSSENYWHLPDTGWQMFFFKLDSPVGPHQHQWHFLYCPSPGTQGWGPSGLVLRPPVSECTCILCLGRNGHPAPTPWTKHWHSGREKYLDKLWLTSYNPHRINRSYPCTLVILLITKVSVSCDSLVFCLYFQLFG